jgi:hypothetical protein
MEKKTIMSISEWNKLGKAFVVFILFSFHFSLFTSCTSTPKDVVMQDALPNIFPDYIGVTIPVEIAPLNFSWP